MRQNPEHFDKYAGLSDLLFCGTKQYKDSCRLTIIGPTVQSNCEAYMRTIRSSNELRTGKFGAKQPKINPISNSRKAKEAQDQSAPLAKNLIQFCERKGVFLKADINERRTAWWKAILRPLPKLQRKELLLDAHILGMISLKQTQALYDHFEMAGV